MTTSTFASRLAASDWAGSDPRLVDALTQLHRAIGADQRALADRAVVLAAPGPVEPRRLVRHATAASFSRVLRLATGLPAAVSTRRPLNDPGGWARDVLIEAFVDQLALGGAASAELARQISRGGELFPAAVRRELDQREIRAVDLLPETAQAVVTAAAAGTNGEGPPPEHVHLVQPTPVTGTPVSSLYDAVSGGERMAVRVLRPRIARDLINDSRLAASAAAVLERVAPDAGGLGPRSFVRLVLRQNLEAVDLRYDALDLVELALVLEEQGHAGIVVARPRAGLLTRRALGIEAVKGEPLTGAAAPAIDAGPVLAALIGMTIESAITHGVFWADPAPEHLLVQPDGRLALVGAATVGRFTPELRRAGVRMIKGVLTGDFGGMVEGLRTVGAIGPETDVDGLLADLAADERIDPAKIMFGGEHALLESIRAVVGIMLAHRLEPPVEVVLLLRTLFATGQLATTLAPDGPGLKAALMGLLPRLPALLADDEG